MPPNSKAINAIVNLNLLRARNISPKLIEISPLSSMLVGLLFSVFDMGIILVNY